MRNNPLPTLSLGLLVSLAGPSLLLGGPAAAADMCPARDLWPTQGWTSQAAAVATQRRAEIAALESFAFTLTGADADRIGTRTDGVVIIKAGRLIYEKYARGYADSTPHYTWSVTKSVTNAFTGLAVASGALTINDSVCTHVPEIGPAHCDITVQDLLKFSSGLDWKETYENESNQVSSVLAMLYGEGSHDMLSFVAGHPSRDPPGATYMYSTGETTFLMGVVDHALRNTLPASLYDDYDSRLLFEPLGLDSATFERDGVGTPVGGSYFYATPRDMAKFGYLYLNDGCWEGQRMLPTGWVHDSVQVSMPFKMKPLDTSPGDVQGRQFWLNVAVPEQSVPIPWPDVPTDAYAARGHWGQSITMVPSLDLIIVRTADDRDGTFDFNQFLKLALAVAR